MTLPRNFRATLQKYAFDPKNPTGAGLPKSLTAPKPAAPLPKGLTEQAQSMWSTPAAQNSTPKPAKLLGAGAPSIGAGRPPLSQPVNNSSALGVQPPTPAQNSAAPNTAPRGFLQEYFNPPKPAANANSPTGGASPYIDTLDRWYNPWTKQTSREGGEANLMRAGQTALGVAGSTVAGATAAPIAAATGLTMTGTGGALTTAGTLATVGQQAAVPAASAAFNHMTGISFPDAQQQPATATPSPTLTLSGASSNTVSPQPATPAPQATESQPSMAQSTAAQPTEQSTQQTPPPEQAPPASAAPPTQQPAADATAAQPAAPKTPEQQQQANTDLMARMSDPNVSDADKKQAAQQHVQQMLDSKPEMKQGMADLHAGKDTPQAKQFQAEVDKAGNAYIREEFARLKAENPNAGPQEQGGMLNSVMQGWQNMPEPMKWMMGIGLGGGLLGMLGSMFGGGGGMGLMGLLGLGAAGVAGAAGGMFGQGAQNMTADALSGIGQFTGMMPEKLTDEQKKILLSKDPTAEITGAGGWSVPTRDTAAKQVAAGKQQLGQIQMLNSMGGMTPRMLENMGLSPEEAQIAARNVGTLSADYANPDSALNQHIQRGESYAQPGWGNAITEWTAGNSYMPWNWGANKTSSAIIRQATTRWANKHAMNDVDQKELTDLKAHQAKTKKYDLKNTRRMHELQKREAAESTEDYVVKICMKSASRWASQKTAKQSEATSDEWLRKYRARGQKGRWLSTQRSDKKEHKIPCK